MLAPTTDREKLTADNLKTIGPGLHTAGGGLYLRVVPAGTRSWVYRFMMGGRQFEMGLGSLKDVKTITAAKKFRDDAALLKAQGINPIEDRRQKVAAVAAKQDVLTFEAAMKGWLVKKTPELGSPKYRRQIENQLQTYAVPSLGTTPIDQITTGMAEAMLTKGGFWSAKNPTATKVRMHCEEIWDWAKTTRKFAAVGNPFAWHGNLKHVLGKPSLIHKSTPHAAVPWDDMPRFMADLRSRDSISARLLEFTILTAARTEESLYAKVEEVNEVERAWTVPAERMKGTKNKKTEHRVPLSTRAMDIYRALSANKKPDDFLFSHADRGHLSTGAMDRMLEIMSVKATAHGTARSSFSTWRFEDEATAERFDQEIVEASLHHKLGEDTMLSYMRGKGFERRRALMEAWSRFCASA